MPKKDLRHITKLTDLISYLRDELEWPLESDDIDDLTYDYEPEELGIDTTKVPKIKAIKQIRPISRKQPFGIFWVEFDNKNLPIVIMRRILQGLVKTNKGKAKSSERAAWNLHDLLFISSFGEKSHREISFAHFSEPENRQYGDLPTLRVLGWDSQDTVLKLEYVEKTLQSKLKWPEESIDPKEWRENWAKAFELRPREIIQTSERLAVLLADLARNIRNRAEKILEVENKNGVLKKLHLAFKEALIHDLTENDFADTYAQTIAYGLLAARVSRPSGIIADNVSDMVPITNPFLKEMLETFLKAGGRKGKMDFDELGVQEVVDLLNSDTTKMELVLKDFGNRTRQEDPVIHFYELFLKEYDKAKKVERGVFYTPHPVVSFIVRSVHEVLQKEFGLEDGLASTITWKEFAKLNKVEIPNGVTPDSPFVLILDPATGTATFLVEVIDIIYKTMCAKWEVAGKKKEISKLWNEYVPKHLLPRLYGFELMMAPYAIAHMKIGLKLQETGYLFQSTERVRVYLTNALEPEKIISDQLPTLSEALAHEAEAVNAVKTNVRFTVVVGNPPYSYDSLNSGDWISNLVRHYYQVDGKELGERNPKGLQDDYIKFIRLCENILSFSPMSILGYITNNGYIDNPTFRGMRQSIMNTFSDIRIIDLHGNMRKKEKALDGSKDENVFNIMQGTAIGIFIRSLAKEKHQYHIDLYGMREEKFKSLSEKEKSFFGRNWTSLEPTTPFYLLVPQNKDLEREYNYFPTVINLIPFHNYGFKTHRDHYAIDFEKLPLKLKIDELISLKSKNKTFSEKYDLGEWDYYSVSKKIKNIANFESCIDRCAYRPYDNRFMIYSEDIMDRIRPDLKKHIFRKINLCLVISRQVATEKYCHVFVTNLVPNDCLISNITKESNHNFPLYLYPSDDGMFQSERLPNFTKDFLDVFIPYREKKTPIELSVFRYIYAIFYSPIYRERYVEFLKGDFPRIPIPKTKELFQELSNLGNDLIALHLLQEEDSELVSVANLKKNRGIQISSPKDYKVDFFSKGKSESIVEKGYPKYEKEKERVYVNEADFFESVPEEVWNFHIGGYQVLHKWLKDRRERALSDEDVLHYRKVIISLRETIVIMREVDEVIGRFGGFPDAFRRDDGDVESQKKKSFYKLTKSNAPQELAKLSANKIKAKLLEETNSKCAYCETAITLETMNIDHYYPKILYADLSMDWNNLFACCKTCNIYKGDKFPLDGLNKPLILNPFLDDYSEHFQVNNKGEFESISKFFERGKVTIDILGLNRPDLVDRRKKIGFEFSKNNKNEIKLTRNEEFYFYLYSIFEENNNHKKEKEEDNNDYDLSVLMNPKSSLDDEEEQTKLGSEQEDIKKDFRNIIVLVDSLEIRNFKGINHLNISLQSENPIPCLVILGENGTGKTSILQSICIGLTSSKNSIILSEIIKEIQDLIKEPKKPAKINLNYGGINETSSAIIENNTIKITNTGQKMPILAYGANRLGRHISEQSVYGNFTHIYNVKNLFELEDSFINPFEWLLFIPDYQFKISKIILKEILFLNKNSDIQRDLEDKQVYLIENKERIKLQQISEGRKNILVLVCDILYRMSSIWYNGDGYTEKDYSGVVLIDEIDAHLHPTWKMKIVSQLRKTFPKLQFICTTHDPLCLKGFKQGEIVVLRKDKDGKVFMVNPEDLPNPEAMRADQLLTSPYFGLSSTIDPKIEEDFEEYYDLLAREDELNEEEKETVKVLEKKLKDKYGMLGDNYRDEMLYKLIDRSIAKRKENINSNEISISDELISKIDKTLDNLEI